MKIRTGFVSNSSSSSFCIIGTRRHAKDIAEKAGVCDEDFGYGQCEASGLVFIGTSIDDCTLAGIDAESLLKTMTIPEAKKHLIKLIKSKFKIDIAAAVFEYGESSSE